MIERYARKLERIKNKMDTSYLNGWDPKKEQQKADFMEHMYQCSGRTNGCSLDYGKTSV